MGLRPFWHYYGSKWALSRYYPDPLHDTIVEPFAGSAGYAMRHYKRRVILIDKNPDITDLWRFLVRVSPEEIRSIPIVPVGGDVRDANLPREWELLVSWNGRSWVEAVHPYFLGWDERKLYGLMD